MSENPEYRNDGAPISARVDDLLERMTVEEKVGQLVNMWVGTYSVRDDEREEGRLKSQSLGDVKNAIREYNIGSTTPFGTGISQYNNTVVISRIANQLQRVAKNETRLGIPLLIPVDAVHGHANVNNSTVFPHNLGMAATWDRDLVREAGRVTAREMRATGATQNYSPNADVARDPRWGRTYETYGESPHLVRELVEAEVAGLQSGEDPLTDRVAATAKHFPAYSGPQQGEDAAPVDISSTTMHRVYLPSFQRAIDAGVSGIMPSYNSLNGEPTHSSRRYLTELLRDELGFDGGVYSDWHGVEMLWKNHGTAKSLFDAVGQSLAAGVDVCSAGGPQIAECILDLVASGEYPVEELDQNVRRVLETKFSLGLFEDPFVNPAESGDTVGKTAHRQVALEAVRRSVTLVRNDSGTLPLDPEMDSVLVTGPNADSINNQCGGWSVVMDNSYQGTTVLDGVSSVTTSNTEVLHEEGASMTEVDDLERVRAKAAESDAAVVALGENWYIHEFGPQSVTGPTGEFPTRSQLRLPEAQRRLIETVSETGTPTVLVLISGRPLVLTDVLKHADAIMMGYLPGAEGGQGIAEALFGKVNPTGKLPISMPKSIGQLPMTHDRLPSPKPIGKEEHIPSYDPLFEFGHGLSYGDCSYEAIDVTDSVPRSEDTVDVTVQLRNESERDVEEVVQLYVGDRVSSRVTPIEELKAFTRVAVPAGARTEATLTLDLEDLGVVYPDGSSVLEPGVFELSTRDLSTELRVT